MHIQCSGLMYNVTEGLSTTNQHDQGWTMLGPFLEKWILTITV
jgi:hypothetical protein